MAKSHRGRMAKQEYNSKERLTEPDQAYTIGQLISRMQQGWQPATEYQKVYDELADLKSFDLSKVSRLDPTELDTMLDQLGVQIDEAKAEAEALKQHIATEHQPEPEEPTDPPTE